MDTTTLLSHPLSKLLLKLISVTDTEYLQTDTFSRSAGTIEHEGMFFDAVVCYGGYGYGGYEFYVRYYDATGYRHLNDAMINAIKPMFEFEYVTLHPNRWTV